MRWGVTSENQNKMVIVFVARGNSRTRKRVVFEGDEIVEDKQTIKNRNTQLRIIKGFGAKMCSLSQQSFLIPLPTLLNPNFRSSRTRKTVVVYCSCTQPQHDDQQQQSLTPLR